MSGGAEGQIDVPNPMPPAEAPDGQAGEDEPGEDDRLNVPEGAQQHGPVDPAHGAAGGHDVPFWLEGASGSNPPAAEGTGQAVPLPVSL